MMAMESSWLVAGYRFRLLMAWGWSGLCPKAAGGVFLFVYSSLAVRLPEVDVRERVSWPFAAVPEGLSGSVMCLLSFPFYWNASGSAGHDFACPVHLFRLQESYHGDRNC